MRGDVFARRARRSSGRWDVVEEAAVFVVGNEEDGLGPLRRVGGERVDNGGECEFTEQRRCWRMVGFNNGRNDPGDLRKIPGGGVGDEVGRELRAECILVKLRGWILEVLEIGQDVVGKRRRSDALSGVL